MLSKMPKVSTEKTESAPKEQRRVFYSLVGLLLLLLLAVVFSFLHQTSLTIDGHKFTYEVAATQAVREKGLSNRVSLPTNHAMLFVFDQSGEYCFWMKDMRFPLDMIWLDANKKIIYIQENATPASYPAAFCPGQFAQYVVEVNDGRVHADGIKLGDYISF